MVVVMGNFKQKGGSCVTETKPIVEFKNVSKSYDNGKQALKNINLTIYPGDFVCLIGTSGAGKTTTMRMINRMLEPSSGEVDVDGQNVKDQNPIQLRRHIGYVIQNIGLIPHMTLEENIELVPRLLKWPKEKRAKQARHLMKLVELPTDFLNRYPSELSGGQQQRIGVIRALAADQKVVLMDEPFGALDPITRAHLQSLVKKLQENMGTTIIMITHDMHEAMTLANKLVVMNHGQIVQTGSPTEIIKHPANNFVEGLIGQQELAEARAELSTAETVIKKDPITIAPSADLVQAATMMRDHHVDGLLVVDDDNHLMGSIDIATLMDAENHHLHVGDIMESHPQTVKSTAPLRAIVRPMLNGNFKYVPVVDADNRLVGIITRATLVNILYDHVWGPDHSKEPKNSKADDRS